MSNPILNNNKGIIDVVKFKWWCIIFTCLLLIPGILAIGYSLAKYHTPLKLGIDFTGGTMIQYGFNRDITKADEGKIRSILANLNINNPVIQTTHDVNLSEKPMTEAEKLSKKFEEKESAATNAEAQEAQKAETENADKTAGTAEKTAQEVATDSTVNPNEIKSIVSIKTRYLETTKDNSEMANIDKALEEEFGTVQHLQTNAIGPTLGQELFKNSMITLILAFVGIIIYLSFRFQFDYAIFAFLALLHDVIFVVGMFSLFGILFDTHVDGLFVTALLTVIGFSVHDTIVVYDRVRENYRFLAKKMSFGEIVNVAVNQTLMRSIATSVTTLLTLFALYFLGGETTKDFVLAMILGISIGTYSSIFFASMLLALYRDKKDRERAMRRAL